MKIFRATFMLTAIALTLNACGGGGSDSSQPRSDVTPYLNVSVPEFYFGTRSVGSTATHAVELSNRSADIYPINRVTLNGPNAEEFELEFGGGITLNPSEKVAVDVSFIPLFEGLKNADIKVEYDIISQATAADNLNEQLYYEANTLENKRHYKESLARYKNYMQSDPVTVNKARAAIKLPVLNESQKYGEGADFTQYVSALNERDEGASSAAIASLDVLLSEYPNSYLADDALYLQGYIELIDNQDYDAALQHMQSLQTLFPQSTYLDTAIYSEAVALEESGEWDLAADKYTELLERHRSVAWAAMNLNLAKDNFTSRLWFARANQGLDRVAG